MSELSVGSLSGLAANSYVIDVASGSTLDLSNGAIFPPGGIEQIVRVTDSTRRDTTSTSFTDVSGMSVTITPTSASNYILILATFLAQSSRASAGDVTARFQITDSSDVGISGAETMTISGNSLTLLNNPMTLVGYVAPATTSAVTYKLRFNATTSNTVSARNDVSDGQMYAIEIAA